MWILPKNYQLSSAFAQDMVESREDLTLLESSIESSLMWRSKPSPLRTWSQRWNRVPWFQRLSLRILKPSQRISFETALTLSLEDTRASRFQQQESDLAPKTPDTSGLTSLITSDQYDLFGACLKTSKDTSALDSEKSLAIWKAQVTTQRGEYSARLKSAHLIRESESISWPTPRTTDTNQGRGVEVINGKFYRPSKALAAGKLVGGANLADAVKNWPTPCARDYKCGRKLETLKKSGRGATNSLPDAVNVAAQETGSLNPTWVEWLMGVPTGWTELGSWETE